MEECKIRIKFELNDELKNYYSAESAFEVYEDIGDSVLDEMGKQFNIFLRQAGYIRPNDYLFMESITDEEYDAIEDFLNEYRSKQAE